MLILSRGGGLHGSRATPSRYRCRGFRQSHRTASTAGLQHAGAIEQFSTRGGVRRATCSGELVQRCRNHVANELHASHSIPSYKHVSGRVGNRKWSDEDDARVLLKAQFRYKTEKVFDMKLISPAQAEKLIKANSLRRWKS